MIEMNYNIIPLKGPAQYELNGVRFNKKSFMYWKNRSSHSIRGVTVVFSKEQENVPVYDEMVVLSLKGLTSYNDLKEAILIFQQIVPNKQLRFQLVVGNENEKRVADALGRDLGLSYEIRESFGKDNKNVDEVEDKLQNSNSSDLSANGSQTITTEQNGISRSVTITDGKGYINSGALSINEEKKILLEEWKRDPVMLQKIQSYSPKVLDDMLTKAVTSNLTSYRMESSLKQSANDKVGEIAMKKAQQEDGLVNANLGIVQNHVSSVNQYSAVEGQGENIQVVNPNVVNSTIGSNGVTNSSGGSNERGENIASASDDQVEIKEQEEQQRKVESVIYLDQNGNLFDASYNWIGELNRDGYVLENNMIFNSNGEKIGIMKPYEENVEQVNSNIYSNPKVRTLKKPEREYGSSNKQAAFVRLPVIIFVLSALLLIASAVLLFIVD